MRIWEWWQRVHYRWACAVAARVVAVIERRIERYEYVEDEHAEWCEGGE